MPAHDLGQEHDFPRSLNPVQRPTSHHIPRDVKVSRCRTRDPTTRHLFFCPHGKKHVSLDQCLPHYSEYGNRWQPTDALCLTLKKCPSHTPQPAENTQIRHNKTKHTSFAAINLIPLSHANPFKSSEGSMSLIRLTRIERVSCEQFLLALHTTVHTEVILEPRLVTSTQSVGGHHTAHAKPLSLILCSECSFDQIYHTSAASLQALRALSRHIAPQDQTPPQHLVLNKTYPSNDCSAPQLLHIAYTDLV